jgi:hypothetical protein
LIYPSIGNFNWSKKKYTFEGQKGEKKPKNGIWGPKSVWACDIIHRSGILHGARKIILLGVKKSPKSVCSCDLTIDRKFYMEQEQYTFEGQIGENKP